jgi:hypothetical protein
LVSKQDQGIKESEVAKPEKGTLRKTGELLTKIKLGKWKEYYPR